MFNLNETTQKEARLYTRVIPADKLTPIRILSGMGAKVLLESAYSETGKGKYSILLLKEAFTLFKKQKKYWLRNPDGRKYHIKPGKKDFLDVITEFRNRAYDDKTLYDFPIPLGGIGYLGYEYFEEIENFQFSVQDEIRGDIDDSAFIFGRSFLIFDHLHDRALIVTAFYQGEIEDVDLEKEADEIEEQLKSLESQQDQDQPVNAVSRIISESDNRDEYIRKVEAVKKEIYKGNLIQCVLSRRVQIETGYQPVDIYRRLRMNNPSPYMFYLDFNHFVIFGTSPEVMVKMKGDKITVRPIAGTRKRGETQAEDLELEKDLRADIKENAEHLMLVDLARNDCGVVSKGGTVHVTADRVVERYSNVMHLVSEVEGKLAPGKDVNDVIKATFPAGTVSGAPKIQSIKTIDQLEGFKRGVYAGLVGYFERNGDFDSCIAIRTAVCLGNQVWLQAGAGLVYDSVPELEYQETENKMMALYLALGITNRRR